MSVETPGVSGTHRVARADGDNDGECAFVLDGIGSGAGSVNFCNAPSQSGSAYCPPHHAFCHLPAGSVAERQRLREIEALANAVGGTQGRAARAPPAPLLRRFDRLARVFSRPRCSLIVLTVAADDTAIR